VLVKICGIMRPGDAEAAAAAGADLVGFIFVPGTPRALDPRDASWIRGLEGVERVGVFRDAPVEEILAVQEALGLDRVQLHGNELDTLIDRLGVGTIRRLRPSIPMSWSRVAELSRRCLPLVDPGAGDGESWAWQALAERPPGITFGLAGGLDPDSVGEAVRVVRPALVDVSSGVESAPGVKDYVKIRDFIAAAREADG
jgi:phosphoribosylanthranilate isomerase